MHEPARFVFLLQQAGLIPATDLAAVSLSGSSCLAAVAASVPWEPVSRRAGLTLQDRFAVIAPGASMPRRVWPIDRWLPIMEYLAMRGLRVVLLAGRSDAGVASELFRMAVERDRLRKRTILLAGQTTIPESVALIAHAEHFFGNDSGPGHIAGALGIPSTILFITDATVDPNDPAAPERVRPLGAYTQCVRPDACLSPCVGSCTAPTAHCITGITSEAVLRAWFTD
jgi:ADP-heptose:LPS heptosyltransferase